MLSALRDTNKFLIPFLRQNLLLLGALFLITETFQNYFLILLAATRESESANLPAMIGQVLSSLIEFVALTMLVPLRAMEHDRPTAQPPESFTRFTQRHIGALTAESLRALAVTLMWSLAFILPGIFKYLRFTFVPYVVVADPEYQKGKRDALEYSNQLAKGITIQLFIIFVLMFLLEMGRSWAREQFPLMQVPHITVPTCLGFFIVNIYANVLLFRIYQLRVIALPASSDKKETSHAT